MAARALISGRVQGVGFRYFVAREARALGVSGFARNLFDGRVEAVFSGEDAQVEAALAACWRGPTGSRVENVEISPAPDANLSDPFEIRGDASV